MELSDRMKQYECIESGRIIMPNVPVLIRLDGRAFHSWTKGMRRPYDERLQALFDETTKFLVEATNAVIGYTQSDEITLILFNGGHSNSQILFDGRVAKLTSVTASMCTAKFNQLVPDYLPERVGRLAFFDARVWAVPTEDEAVNCLIWRELDATRNSISMAAQAHFSHKRLQGVHSDQMQEMLWQERQINWNDYPSRFKRGGYFKRGTVTRKFTANELEALPPQHNARKNPDLGVTRTVMYGLEIPPLLRIANRADVIFRDAKVEKAEV